MGYKIVNTTPFLEIHTSGNISPWDHLRIVHQLQRHDPEKKTPDLWVLHPDLDFSIHSFPLVVKGIMKLSARLSGKTCKTAVVAADEFQKVKLDMFCAEAGDLPYEISTFTSRDEAIDWLQS